MCIKMEYPHIVLEELRRFNDKLLDTRNEENIKNLIGLLRMS